jgi:hypothetical protein
MTAFRKAKQWACSHRSLGRVTHLNIASANAASDDIRAVRIRDEFVALRLERDSKLRVQTSGED